MIRLHRNTIHGAHACRAKRFVLQTQSNLYFRVLYLISHGNIRSISLDHSVSPRAEHPKIEYRCAWMGQQIYYYFVVSCNITNRSNTSMHNSIQFVCLFAFTYTSYVIKINSAIPVPIHMYFTLLYFIIALFVQQYFKSLKNHQISWNGMVRSILKANFIKLYVCYSVAYLPVPFYFLEINTKSVQLPLADEQIKEKKRNECRMNFCFFQMVRLSFLSAHNFIVYTIFLYYFRRSCYFCSG